VIFSNIRKTHKNKILSKIQANMLQSQKSISKNIQNTSIALALAAINLTIGGIVSWMKLPIYLDTIGLIISTVLLGWRFGLLTGIVTVGVGFFIINPYLPAYTATLIALVITTEFLAKKVMFRSIGSSVAAGIILAIVAATISAPVTAYLFGGVTASGADLLTALLRQTGQTILQSVILSGVSSELVDKTLVSVAACLIFRSLPRRFFAEFSLRSQKPNPDKLKP
jgi:energy-coupling factor transport system substrate-specific component